MRHGKILSALLLAVLALASCVAVSEAPRSGADKVTVCHKGKTLRVAAAALDAHLRHGDARGPCR